MGRLFLFLIVAQSSPLAVVAADWSALDRYQQTVTRAEFDKLVTQVYTPSGALTNYLTFTTNSVQVFSTPAKSNTALFTLTFASTPPLNPNLPPNPPPLRRIALDPGHIGGRYARMEERFFQRGRDRPIQEAALNLAVSRLLKIRLESAGLTVLLTKNDFHPVTDKRPKDFLNEPDPKRRALLFYRTAELAARARRVNEELKPDLTLCIHFNAVEWNECHDLVDDNRLVVFIHGNYLPAELADDNQKFRLFAKLLEGSHRAELAAAEAIATALAKATQLPPVQYEAVAALASRGMFPSAVRVGDNPYLYARNLAANRLYNGPVIYLEPYYMNNRMVYERLQLGDYDGERDIEGRKFKSIFREYADAVTEGLKPFIRR